MTKSQLIQQVSMQIYVEAAGSAIAAGSVGTTVTFPALVSESIIAAEMLCAGWIKWLSNAPAGEQSYLFDDEVAPAPTMPSGMPNPVSVPPTVSIG